MPMFRTNIPNQPVGPFRGELVVSMRPYALASRCSPWLAQTVLGFRGADGSAWPMPALPNTAQPRCSVPADRCSVRATGVLPSARAAPSFVPVAAEGPAMRAPLVPPHPKVPPRASWRCRAHHTPVSRYTHAWLLVLCVPLPLPRRKKTPPARLGRFNGLRPHVWPAAMPLASRRTRRADPLG